SAETNAALRGHTRSSQPPQVAAETPSSTKKNVYIQPRSNWLQLQSVAVRACSVPSDFSAKVTPPCEHSGSALPSAPRRAPCSGFQNTEKPQAMPMHRWMQRAAGGERP